MSLSADTGGISPDLMLVAKGGEEFASRLVQLDTAKKEALDAFSALSIGKDAKAAWDEANAAKLDIKAQREKAQAEIAEMLQVAQAQCDTMRTEAGLVVADANQRAKETLAEAQAAADAMKDEASQTLKDARAKVMEAGRKSKSADDAKAAADQALADAQAAQAAAEAAEAKYKQILQTLMGHITDALLADKPETPDAG